jgi:hypothetical protein
MRDLIQDSQRLVSAAYDPSGYAINTYDNGFGPLWISRNSLGINGIVRAKTGETAYSICEDEFFPEADESIEQIQKEYGFEREHVKIVKDQSVLVASGICKVGERIARFPDDYPDGKLVPVFLRWETIETRNPDAWPDNELFQEAFGFRPNGPNVRDTLNHGIYSKDLNGDSLDLLTPQLIYDIGIKLTIEEEE